MLLSLQSVAEVTHGTYYKSTPHQFFSEKLMGCTFVVPIAPLLGLILVNQVFQPDFASVSY